MQYVECRIQNPEIEAQSEVTGRTTTGRLYTAPTNGSADLQSAATCGCHGQTHLPGTLHPAARCMPPLQPNTCGCGGFVPIRVHWRSFAVDRTRSGSASVHPGDPGHSWSNLASALFPTTDFRIPRIKRGSGILARSHRPPVVGRSAGAGQERRTGFGAGAHRTGECRSGGMRGRRRSHVERWWAGPVRARD